MYDSPFRVVEKMAWTPDNRLATVPRVRVLCARTGEFLYEPTHPRLEQIRLYVLKKWTWINGRVDLPEAHTLFSLIQMAVLQHRLATKTGVTGYCYLSYSLELL